MFMKGQLLMKSALVGRLKITNVLHFAKQLLCIVNFSPCWVVLQNLKFSLETQRALFSRALVTRPIQTHLCILPRLLKFVSI